jgi:hypothetical protein
LLGASFSQVIGAIDGSGRVVLVDKEAPEGGLKRRNTPWVLLVMKLGALPPWLHGWRAAVRACWWMGTQFV